MPKINDTYDIGKAFEAIEDELIASMIRNMKSHKVEEVQEDKQWSMWQVEQLKALERYKKKNQKKYEKIFKDINKQIETLIGIAHDKGEMEQEIEILNAIKNGFQAEKIDTGVYAEFFRLNERKLEALIKATVHDMERAEVAILRKVDDDYRKIIFNAQTYANSGAGTYEKAVDMATKDMLAAGLTCIEYANGARHTLADYADMAIRTASKRAYLQGEGTMRKEWNISTVIVNKRGNPCPKCLPFCGKVLVDDVWSGGSKEGISETTGLKYPLMSSAVAAGLYHPRCKDVHTTYFEGISTPPDDKYTREELDQIAENYRKEQKQQYAERQVKKFERLEKYSLDKDNKKIYKKKASEWKLIKEHFSADADFSWIRAKFGKPDIKTKSKEFYHSLVDIEDDNIYQLLRNSYKRVEFKESPRRKSFFNRTEHIVYLVDAADNTTIAHELFHEIDNNYGITKSGLLSDVIRKDYENLTELARKSGKTIEDMLYSKYPKAFSIERQGVCFEREYRGISDIINGMSGGKIRLGYYHSEDYWKKSGKLESETWAQYGRMFYQNDNAIILAGELFPNTTRAIKQIIKELE